MSRRFKGDKKADTIQKVGELRASGFTYHDIGEMLGYSKQRVCQIWNEFHRQKSVVAHDVNSGLNGCGKVPP